jgi:hypothetical protein
VLSLLARIVRLASAAMCAITIASFALFAINQTGTASAHQQRLLNGQAPAQASAQHESSARKLIDEASDALTSPFSGVVSSSSGEWATRTTRVLLALAVYGFGLGFVARVLRMRA